MSELVFRKLSVNDTEHIFKASTGNVADYFYKFDTFEQAEEWVKDAVLKQEEGSKLEYVIYEGDNFIGMISPRYLNFDTVDIGMWVSIEFQGKGYGKRILETLLTMLKQDGVREVIYETDIENKASAALAQSLGFQLTSDAESLVFKLTLN